MSGRVAAVIQARLGSSRLPGKTLADIAGEPMLAHLVQRVRAIPGVDLVVLATTDRSRDDALETFAVASGLPVVRGSEGDVLDRFHRAIDRFPADVVVRVTPDCPLLDPAVSGLVLRRFLDHERGVDYASNVHPPTYPDGLDTEVFSAAALDTAWREARLLSEREHVTPFIWKHPERFRLLNVACERDLSAFRWTVDTEADLAFVRGIFARLGTPLERRFAMDDVLALLARDPGLAAINAGQHRNEGYVRSLAADAGARA